MNSFRLPTGLLLAVLLQVSCTSTGQLSDQAQGRTLFHEALAQHDARKVLSAQVKLGALIGSHPESYWARRAVEVLAQEGAGNSARTPAAPTLLRLYDALKGTGIAGHLLYYAARELAAPPASPDTARDAERRCQAVYLLVLVVDHHSTSPLWDDALWFAADLLHEDGHLGDEVRLLEEALLPHPGRGIDTLLGRFVQKVRYRLARLYVRQGRHEEALYQLSLVINLHASLPLKDDALWSIARICAGIGDEGKEREALLLLLECCPWSRHTARVQRRLGRE